VIAVEHVQVNGFLFVKFNYISENLSLFCEATKLSKIATCKALNKLKSMNMITKKGNVTKKGNTSYNIYLILKDYSQWKPLPKKVKPKALPKKVTTITKKGNEALPKTRTTIDTITKDTITIDTIAEINSAGHKNIIKLFDIFKSVNPLQAYENKTHRSAAEEILKRLGEEKAFNTATAAVAIQGKEFAPTITNPYQLKIKLGELLAFYKRRESSRVVDIDAM